MFRIIATLFGIATAIPVGILTWGALAVMANAPYIGFGREDVCWFVVFTPAIPMCALAIRLAERGGICGIAWLFSLTPIVGMVNLILFLTLIDAPYSKTRLSVIALLLATAWLALAYHIFKNSEPCNDQLRHHPNQLDAPSSCSKRDIDQPWL